MKEWVKKYWLECLIFLGIGLYYLIGVSPVMSFMSMAGDGFDYVVGSKNFWSVRPTGYPTYIILSWVFEKIPGNDFWSLGLFSALCAWLTCVFIYLSIYTLTKNRLASVIGALTYAGSFLVWTQAVVPQMRCLNALLMVLAVYCVIKGRWYLAAIPLALGVGIHHTIVWALFPLFGYLVYLKYKRDPSVSGVRIWVWLGIVSLGFLAYLQTILCLHDRETTNGIGSVMGQSGGSFGFVYALPLTKTWQRITEAVPILLTGMGISLVLLLFVPWKKNRLYILIGIVALLNWCYYFFSNIPMWTFYAVPAFAFGAVLAGVGVDNFPFSKKWLPAFMVVPLAFCCFNRGMYDIGLTIDPTPTSAERCYQVLDTIPDDSIVYIEDGEDWLLTYYYVVENNHRFVELFSGEIKYHTDKYVDWKEDQGISIPEDLDKYGTRSLNRAFYVEWDHKLFLRDLQELNPERQVLVLRRWGPSFEDLGFSLVPICADNSSIKMRWDCE